MHWGRSFLAELSKRGTRYEHLSFEEHQELKAAASENELQRFFGARQYAIETGGRPLAAIAEDADTLWSRPTAVQKSLWIGSLASTVPEAALLIILAAPVVLLVLAPVLLLWWLIRLCRR